jgi:tetratricopeptide (TPR) repeat protein
MFVLLALVFAGGFVFFGVGSGSTGLGDLLHGNFIFGNDNKSSSGLSVKDARAKIAKNPSDASAYRELSSALQADARPEQAIAPLEKYVQLRPRDVDALGTLATLYLTKASRLQARLQVLQAQSQPQQVAQNPALNTSTPLGQALTQDPFAQSPANPAIAADASQIATQIGQTATKAIVAYKRITRLRPDDPGLQLQLAQAAQAVGDAASAIAAYKAYLRIAPDDPNAAIVKQQLKVLQRQNGGSSQAAPSR